MDHGVIDSGDYSVVHDKMYGGVSHYGGRDHRGQDPYHEPGDRSIKYWIKNQRLDQRRMTDYVRVFHGRIVLDEVENAQIQRK